MKRILNREKNDIDDSQNPRVKTAIYLLCVAAVCTLLVLILVSIYVILLLFCYLNLMNIFIK